MLTSPCRTCSTGRSKNIGVSSVRCNVPTPGPPAVTSTWKVAAALSKTPGARNMPTPSKLAALAPMVACVTWPRTAISVKPGYCDDPAIRQLKCPWTEPSADRVTLNPNCENVRPSAVPLPLPVTTAGPAADARGTSAQAATNTASAPQTRFMLSPFLPRSNEATTHFVGKQIPTTSLLPSNPEPAPTRAEQLCGRWLERRDHLARSAYRRSAARYPPHRPRLRTSTRKA